MNKTVVSAYIESGRRKAVFLRLRVFRLFAAGAEPASTAFLHNIFT